MKTIKGTTKKGHQMLINYWRSVRYDLYDCYTTHSTAKENAFRECKKMMEEENGIRMRILSYNKFGFTCGWLVKSGIRIETPQNSYLVKYANNEDLPF